MARRKRRSYRRRSGFGGLGGKGLIGKYIPLGGAIGGAAGGLIGLELAKRFMPSLATGGLLPRAAIGFISGGVGGAGAAALLPNVLGGITNGAGAGGAEVKIYG